MQAQHSAQKVPILMYHSISRQASPQFRPFIVTPPLFEEHLSYLKQEGYTPLTVSEFLVLRNAADASLPERPIVLTFDDGFADFYTDALPLLQKYGFPATLYVTTGYVNETSRWLQRRGEGERPMLSWTQLAELHEHGIELGAHTHTHPQLDLLSHAEAWSEITQSKTLLEGHLAIEVASFAYPFGYHTSAVRRQVIQAGFSSACAVKYAMSSTESDIFALARLFVSIETDTRALAHLLSTHALSSLNDMYIRARAPIWRLARWGMEPFSHAHKEGASLS